MDKKQLANEIKKYKPQMTSSERAKAYFNGERVDHLPYEIFCTDWVIAAEMGYKLADLADIDIMTKVIEKRFNDYKIDGFAEGAPLKVMAEAVGSKVTYPENDIDYIDEFLMEEELDMSLLGEFDPYKNPTTKKKLQRARKLKERFPEHPIGTQVSGPITVAAGIRPINKLLRDFRKNPEVVKELLEYSLDLNISWIKAFTNEFGPRKINIADPVGCDDILSPKQLSEFSHPYLDRLVESIIDITGNRPGLHVCGHTSKQWPYYRDLGIDLYSLDDCENLADIKLIVEDNTILEGNVPPVEVMRFGTIDDVIDSVKSCILQAGDAKNGLIVATGCDLPIGTPKENFDAFIYAVSKYGKDAKIGEMPKAVFE